MKKMGHILILDDDEDVLFTAKTILKKYYEKVSTETSPKRLEYVLRSESVDVVVLDMNFQRGKTSGTEGLFWLKRIKELKPEVQVLMNTAYGDIDLAVECMKLGAVDFLVKPWPQEKLLTTVRNIFDLQHSRKRVVELQEKESALKDEIKSGVSDLLFQSEVMQKLVEMADQVANTDASVLILGENGTGKEVLARRIHEQSDRSGETLVKVDLGAITESLFESELFGHVKGAFTDAQHDKMGRFEVANAGTLFLDEIANCPLNMQMKLLSALQNRMIQRVGSSANTEVDVRLISATNVDLHHLIDLGSFRQDLLYRINTVELTIPPLRERTMDIPLLAEKFLNEFARKYQKAGVKMAGTLIKQLSKYDWPGNVRELRHAMERAVILSRKPIIDSDEFILPKKKWHASNSLKVEDVEQAAIQRALQESEGNLSKAASTLGIGRTTLYRKMKKFNIEAP
ncbi:MAG: sigma-54-dependent Fis family transcriptional regulator [Cyclobacteriaceae bacterium]